MSSQNNHNNSCTIVVKQFYEAKEQVESHQQQGHPVQSLHEDSVKIQYMWQDFPRTIEQKILVDLFLADERVSNRKKRSMRLVCKKWESVINNHYHVFAPLRINPHTFQVLSTKLDSVQTIDLSQLKQCTTGNSIFRENYSNFSPDELLQALVSFPNITKLILGPTILRESGFLCEFFQQFGQHSNDQLQIVLNFDTDFVGLGFRDLMSLFLKQRDFDLFFKFSLNLYLTMEQSIKLVNFLIQHQIIVQSISLRIMYVDYFRVLGGFTTNLVDQFLQKYQIIREFIPNFNIYFRSDVMDLKGLFDLQKFEIGQIKFAQFDKLRHNNLYFYQQQQYGAYNNVYQFEQNLWQLLENVNAQFEIELNAYEWQRFLDEFDLEYFVQSIKIKCPINTLNLFQTIHNFSNLQELEFQEKFQENFSSQNSSLSDRTVQILQQLNSIKVSNFGYHSADILRRTQNLTCLEILSFDPQVVSAEPLFIQEIRNQLLYGNLPLKNLQSLEINLLQNYDDDLLEIVSSAKYVTSLRISCLACDEQSVKNLILTLSQLERIRELQLCFNTSQATSEGWQQISSCLQKELEHVRCVKLFNNFGKVRENQAENQTGIVEGAVPERRSWLSKFLGRCVFCGPSQL